MCDAACPTSKTWCPSLNWSHVARSNGESRACAVSQESGLESARHELAGASWNDEKVSLSLAERLSAGSISEATVYLFCDELEANKARLPVEEQEAADAQEYMNELQKIVDALTGEFCIYINKLHRGFSFICHAFLLLHLGC